jgi:formate dehydrogenase subunit delta
MQPEKLVRMANQIATFFETQPGTDQAARVAAHLTDFWGPEMRNALKDHAATANQDLNPLVKDALALI